MRISKPGSGLKLAPFRLPLSLSLPVAPPPYPLACSDSLANPLCRSSADVGVLCSPGCSLALSHPQCAHRTRPGRKSFPLRRAYHARFFVIEPFTTYSIIVTRVHGPFSALVDPIDRLPSDRPVVALISFRISDSWRIIGRARASEIACGVIDVARSKVFA